MIRVVIAAIAIAALLPSVAFAQQKVSLPSVTPAGARPLIRHEAPAATVTGELYLPAQGQGPWPAMLLKHGSGGMGGATGDNIRKWAKQMNEWGVAVLTVDSFTPRGITDTGSNQGQLSSWADTADAFAGLKLLGADPRIDRKRIGIMGWSRGGTVAEQTALETARKSVITDDLKFALHVILYGTGTFQFRDSATDQSPMLFLHGESDDYVPIAPTRDYAAWLQTKGNAVTFIGYPDTYHDFDVEGGYSGFVKQFEICDKCDVVIDLSDGRLVRVDHKENPTMTLAQLPAYFKDHLSHGAHLAPNPAARADAVEKVHAFLKAQFHLTK